MHEGISLDRIQAGVLRPAANTDARYHPDRFRPRRSRARRSSRTPQRPLEAGPRTCTSMKRGGSCSRPLDGQSDLQLAGGKLDRLSDAPCADDVSAFTERSLACASIGAGLGCESVGSSGWGEVDTGIHTPRYGAVITVFTARHFRSTLHVESIQRRAGAEPRVDRCAERRLHVTLERRAEARSRAA